jgi:hypothetical protein
MNNELQGRWSSRIALALMSALGAVFAIVVWQTWEPAEVGAQEATAEPARTVSAEESAAAFLEAYRVFMHPRCMNCHPKSDAPLQGDDSHPHLQLVKRGPDGKGKYAMKCGACHQDHNLPGENMPPGNPNWHLLTPEMPMVFEGKTPRELALQMVDPKQNGGKSLEQLFHHVAQDSLVLWGWDPGEGRTKPPLTHEEFTKAMRTWIDGGAVAPAK